jgi:hypothetical protein
VACLALPLFAHPVSVAAAPVLSAWAETRSTAAHGGALHTTTVTGASALYSVNGRRFAMWYVAGPRNGRVAVFVNGRKVRTVDQYSPRTVRRAVTLSSDKQANTVMVVALSTRSKASKGTRVNVDAFSPLPARCARGCTKNPRLVPRETSAMAVSAEAPWYPAAVPARTSPEWVVAIGSYVRGRDVQPIDTAVPVIRAAACDQARKVRQGVVVLSFGKQVAGGANGFGQVIPNAQIVATTSAWAAGLAECGPGPWEVALGTSNSGGVTAFNGYLGGRAWANLVAAARAEADSRVIIAGAVDLEPGWGPPGQARAWVDGYVDRTQARLWNFGSADGCPQTFGSDLTCNNGWTIDDVLWVSSHAGPNVLAMPQIHTKSGSQARQWAVLAARGVQMGMPLRLAAITVQTAACTQVRGGCPTTGISAWDGWAQLRRFLDAQPTTVGFPLGAPMDIRWGWANGFVIPPATTTTTSTSTTTTTPTTTTPTTVPATTAPPTTAASTTSPPTT